MKPNPIFSLPTTSPQSIRKLPTFAPSATLLFRSPRTPKGQALLSALHAGFAKAAELGSAEKAIIFTESRRTQEYLVRLLSEQGYDGKLVLFNGSNSDPQVEGDLSSMAGAAQRNRPSNGLAHCRYARSHR